MTLLFMITGYDTMTSSVPTAWMQYYQDYQRGLFEEEIILLMAAML